MRVGTNDLSNNTMGGRTTKSIANVAQLIKSDKCDVYVFSILPRNDKWTVIPLK